MPNPSPFPHLHLTFQGSYEPHFHGGHVKDPETARIKAAPSTHANRIRGILGQIRDYDAQLRKLRAEVGLPAIPADRGFLLKLSNGADVDAILKALGVELVAETEHGLMLVSSASLEFSKIEQVLKRFETGTGGITAASALHDIVWQPNDERRLREMLSQEVLKLWPLGDTTVYTFDLGLQTATSTRDVKWPTGGKRKGETDEQFQRRREAERREAWIAADTEWQNNAETRVNELQPFLHHYGGEFLSGIMSAEGQHGESGMVFPDSVQVRVRMSGAGFKDIIQNFAHLFDVSIPPELHQPVSEAHRQAAQPPPNISHPLADAPTVCVIDSGIQEAHRWLEPAIDSSSSRCFLPGASPADVADYVTPQGHGTRVAGAVLYPDAIPVAGEVNPVAWIQNARVLNAENKLPPELAPEEYLQQVVNHFHVPPRFTRIFNHSINANVPCPRQRMTSWAAKLDQLSHEQDVLFIQSVGNQNRDRGNQPNPGLLDHLDAGRQPPDHLLEESMRVANPAQSLHALTVSSISNTVFDSAHERSFAAQEHHPSGFSRAGYAEPWAVVKPEVVEIGGDFIYSKNPPHQVRQHQDVSIELLNSTMHGAPAYSKDGAGTSFAAPKVAHIAAHLQNLFPNASPLLYRALTVHSARWPDWAENEANKDKILKLVGYGLPSVERATSNSERRVTLITPYAELIPSKQLHLYIIRIPDEVRNAALEARIRIDVTLAYTALPRRTRARRTGYLETWLDWESSKLSEPRDVFLTRMQKGNSAFSESEFGGDSTPEALLALITADGIRVPQASNPIESLNTLLSGSSIRSHFPNVALPHVPVDLVSRGTSLRPAARTKLNRLVLEAAYPNSCPRRVQYEEFPWVIHKQEGWGESEETSRTRGTVQKDWATFDSFNFPEEFAIAVRSHLGWNHLEGAGKARYCLVVSFEVLRGELPIYTLIRNEIEVAEAEAQTLMPATP